MIFADIRNKAELLLALQNASTSNHFDILDQVSADYRVVSVVKTNDGRVRLNIEKIEHGDDDLI
jgi:hypothetical protein